MMTEQKTTAARRTRFAGHRECQPEVFAASFHAFPHAQG